MKSTAGPRTGHACPPRGAQVTAAPDAMHIAAVRDRVRERLVGRERELDLVLAAVAARRDIVLEGPPGTSKSTLLRGITASGASRWCSSRGTPT